ncbi:LppU/SCO3897 family protein [Streptomyces cinereoruber]|uniref:LppU/SCO3897 family protein n=1 Tax=Streptomyces cinereoruber TaxID=67260 RepID=UPI003C2C4D10
MTTPPAPFPSEQQPAPAKKGSAIFKKIGGVVVAIAIAIGVKLGLPHLTGDAPVHAEAGECVTVTGPDNDPKVDTVDCSSGKADLFKVVKVIDNTFDVNKCGEELSALAQQLDSDKFVLCLEEVAAK